MKVKSSISNGLSRKRLGWLILTLFGLLILAFIFVLLRFSGGSTKPSQSGVVVSQDQIMRLSLGETKLHRVAGQRLWLSRLSESQRQQSLAAESYLIDPESGCSRASELCALQAATERSGIEIRFTQTAPPQLPANTVWYGGFVDPLNGRVYDLLGRAYRLKNNRDLNQPSALPVVEVQ